MNFKNVGNSGINKTGATRYFDFVFKTVRGALVSLSLDPVKCLARGVQVMKRSIPSFDNTATQAALLQIISLDHNLFGSFDEQATQMRQFTNGSTSSLPWRYPILVLVPSCLVLA